VSGSPPETPPENPRQRRIQLLTGPRQVGKTTLLLESQPSLAMPQSTPLAMNQTRRFPDFGNVVEPTPKPALAARQQFSCWMRFITWMMGKATQRVLGPPASTDYSNPHRRHRLIRTAVTTASRESLAGRFERLTLSHWSASSLANVFQIPRAEAASLIVQLGSYSWCDGAAE